MTKGSMSREIDKTRVLLRVLHERATERRVALDLGMTPEYVKGLVRELREQGLLEAEETEETTNLKEKT